MKVAVCGLPPSAPHRRCPGEGEMGLLCRCVLLEAFNIEELIALHLPESWNLHRCRETLPGRYRLSEHVQHDSVMHW